MFRPPSGPSLRRWLALASAIASLAVIGATAQTAGAAINSCSGTGGTFAGGAGTTADPYLVSNQAQLEAIRTSTYVACAFRQTADIALTGTWTPIGESTVVPVNKNFRGEYDGNGKTISGLNVSGNNLAYEGLFGYTYGPAIISNLFVSGSVTSNVGGFGLGVVGMADSGTVISNVHADVDVTATGGSIIGGLVGWGPEVTIEESSAAGDVTGDQSVGGLIGQPYGRTFGAPPSRATVTDSYASGKVTGSSTGQGIGGLVGSLQGNDNRIIRSYATGQVVGGTSGAGTSGGLIGPASGGGSYTGLTVTGSFWDTQTTGKSTSADNLGTGKTTAEMKSFSTFNNAGWAITDGWPTPTVWGICDGATYPFLQDQYTSSPCPPPPPPPTNILAIAKTGVGEITSSPRGIDCGPRCAAAFVQGTSVILRASPAQGYTFAGWGGACSGTGTCEVTLSQNRNVTATFQRSVPTHALTVQKQGTGQGTVTSNPSGINCGTACESSYEEGTQVTLTASAAPGSTFTGWSGACSGTGPCQVTMDQARQVTATFQRVIPSYTLAVTKPSDGQGTVTSNPSGINCGAACEASYEEGTVVTLTASAAQGSTFTGWSGACIGTGPCQVTMSQARQVAATFRASPPPPESDVSIELNTSRPATVPASRVLQAVKVSCEGDAPCRIDAASAKAKAGNNEQKASVSFSSDPFQAGTSRVIQVTIPQSVYNSLKVGRKSGLLTVDVRAEGTEGPRDAQIKVGLQR